MINFIILLVSIIIVSLVLIIVIFVLLCGKKKLKYEIQDNNNEIPDEINVNTNEANENSFENKIAFEDNNNDKKENKVE